MSRSITINAYLGAVTPLEEEPNKCFVTNDVAERAECKVGNKDQKQDQDSRDDLMECPARYSGNRVQNRSAVDRSYRNLFNERQDNQKQEEEERPVQRWNNEWKMFESLSNVEGTSHQHELCAERGLDDCHAQSGVGDIIRLQNGNFEIDQRREADVEVGSKDDELPEFLAGFFAERGFRLINALRCCFRLWESRHRESLISFVCSESCLTVSFPPYRDRNMRAARDQQLITSDVRRSLHSLSGDPATGSLGK
jgi:hypothetical protein